MVILSEIKTLNGYSFMDAKAREDIAILSEAIDSGAGGEQADWNKNDPASKAYVQNRTHWTEITEAELLPEATYTIMSTDEPIAVIMSPVTLVDGENYTITYNGTAYICTAITDEDGNSLVGNASALGEDFPTSDEPFLIGCFTDALAAENGFYGMIFPLDGSETFTLSIMGKSEVVHPLPKKYLGELRGQEQITITIAEDGTITSDTPYLVAAKIDMSELQGAVKIVNGANGAVYSACFATTGINLIGVPYITIGFIPAIDVRDTSGLSQSIHTLDWISYSGIDRFVHSSVQTLPRAGSTPGENFFLVWEGRNDASSDLPDGGGSWRSFGLERYRSYIAPRWIKTETITLTEDKTEFTISRDHLNRGEFYCIDEVFIRMCAPAATANSGVQLALYGVSDSDGTISATANNAITTRKTYTLVRIRNVYGYLEIEIGDGGDGFSAATWRGMFANNYMKVRGGFKKVSFRAINSSATIPTGTTFEVWATNTMGD